MNEADLMSETQLINSVKDLSYQDAFAKFLEKFNFRKGLIPKNGATIEMKDYVGAFALGLGMESDGQWVVADAAIALIDAGYENVVIHLSESLNRSYSTVSGWVRTARAFPWGHRQEKLCFTVHKEIGTALLDKDPEINKEKALQLAVKALQEGWNTSEARQHVKEAQGASKPPKEPPPIYLLIDEVEGTLKFSKEIPEFNEDVTIVNIETRQFQAYSEEGVSWFNIPVQ